MAISWQVEWGHWWIGVQVWRWEWITEVMRMTGGRGGTGFFRRWHLSTEGIEGKDGSWSPRVSVFLSWPALGDLCPVIPAEQEASILDLKAVLAGPQVQSGGWALRRPGRQRGDLGRKWATASRSGDQSRGPRPWLTQRCAAQMLLLGRTCYSAVSSFWGESHLLPQGTAPSGEDLETEGAGRRVLPWWLHVGKAWHGSVLTFPWGLADVWGGGLGCRSPSPLPIQPSPLSLTGVDAQQTRCKATSPGCELGHLEGRVGVSSEWVKTGQQRHPVPRPGGARGLGWGVSLRPGADQGFLATSGEGLGI